MPKLKKDTFNDDFIFAPVISYTKDDQKWTILDDVVAGSTATPAVFGAFKKSKLVNKGEIVSYAEDDADLGTAVQFTGNRSKIINEAGADIVGPRGIFIGSISNPDKTKDAKIDNHGTITGTMADAVLATSNINLKVYNDGKILSANNGVYALSGESTTVENAGLIFGRAVGVLLAEAGGTSTIVNHAGGTIKGASQAIDVESDGMMLTNAGKLVGMVDGTDGKDKVVNKGKIKGDVYLKDGNDTYKNKDAKAGPKIHSGEGNDKLVAGNSKDKFVFDAAPGPANLDTIKGFESGKDKLFLDSLHFAAVTGPGPLVQSEFRKGATAKDADDYVLYDKASGALYYDEDGFGGTPEVQIAQFDPGDKVKYSDFTVMA
ncbi:hypothetical protein [Bauldia sp.]|uniref:hypothetical protein n=1 Tax=Bauldia sp. TaxID=2575872 RepID=UPI003BAD8D46